MDPSPGVPQGSPRLRLPFVNIFEGAAEIHPAWGGRPTAYTNWDDLELLAGNAIKLVHLDTTSLLKEVEIFVYGLTRKMSDRAAAAALILTWNMKHKQNDRRVFPVRDLGSDPNDIFASTLEVEVKTYYYDDNVLDYRHSNNKRNEVIRAGSFLAASTLSLFSKPASSWLLAWEHKHFHNKYKEYFNVNSFILSFVEPRNKNVEKLGFIFQKVKLMIRTLGRILYAEGGLVGDMSLVDFLFIRHLKYTGMHIVPLFITAAESLGATTSELVSALDCGNNTKALKELEKLIDESLSKPRSPENRQCWRFARIFDQKAFGLLRTKFCGDEVMVLAYIHKLCNITNETSGGDPMKIAVLSQMGDRHKLYLKNVARNIHHIFTAKVRDSKRKVAEEEEKQTDVIEKKKKQKLIK